MKQLYRCETALVLYVMAEDEKEAAEIAERHADEEANNLWPWMFDVGIVDTDQIDDHYGDYSLPWGGEDSRTIKEIAVEQARRIQGQRRQEKQQLKIFEAK